MYISWFQIKNFRSINDSGKCYLNKNITVFAGKNESGKSNILLALKAFSSGKINKADFVNSVDRNEPEITICFIFNQYEISNLYREILNLKEEEYTFENIDKEASYDCIITRNSNGVTKIEGNYITLIDVIKKKEQEYWKERLKKDIDDLISSNDINQSSLAELSKLNNHKDDVIKTVEYILNPNNSMNIQNDKLKVLNESLDSHNMFTKTISAKQIKNEYLPKIIIFDSFTDMLPASVNSNSVIESNIVNRFFDLVEIKPEQIFNETSKQIRKQLVNKASSKITGDFSSFYKQNDVRLTIEVDNDEISFFLYDQENNDPFTPNQRSQGFQWFLSFYLTLMAENKSENAIILIDEPGLYLHAKAQKDMLEVLDSIAIKNQIVFTTHSPYLLNSDRLNDIRLVLKEDGQTRIESKIQKVSDKDTLTPIITSIGYDLSQGLGVNSKLNLVTEGISDYYYLQAMKEYLNKNYSFTIIPSVGVDQIPNIASILFGWGVPIICLLDNDTQGKGVAKKLKDKLGFEENREILFVSEKNIAIEDLVTSADFYKYVLNEDLIKETETVLLNSKKADGNKVILARKFYDSIKAKHLDIKLQKETTDNFEKIFNTIEKMLQPTKIAQ